MSVTRSKTEAMGSLLSEFKYLLIIPTILPSDGARLDCPHFGGKLVITVSGPPSDDNSKWGKIVPTTKDPQPQLVNHYNIAVLFVDLSFFTLLGPPQRYLIHIPFFCFRQHVVMELIECTSHLVPNHQHQAQLKLTPTGMNRNTHMQGVFVV